MSEQIQLLISKLFVQAEDVRGGLNTVPVSTTIELVMSGYKLGLRTAGDMLAQLERDGSKQNEKEGADERGAEASDNG